MCCIWKPVGKHQVCFLCMMVPETFLHSWCNKVGKGNRQFDPDTSYSLQREKYKINYNHGDDKCKFLILNSTSMTSKGRLCTVTACLQLSPLRYP
jgi:hypothetical protein